MTASTTDSNLLRNPLGWSNARFLLVRSVGLGVLLWLYSVQAGEQRVSPTALRGASVQFAPASVKNFEAFGDVFAEDPTAIQKAINAGLKPLHIPAAN